MPAATHHVFVDFENVPGIDLGHIDGHPVRVTLLIGKNQKKLPLQLVQQIHKLADRVELVDVGASGRNALDLTLACYLGRAVQTEPKTNYAIVSRDKDFDPMIGHLKAHGISVSRHESVAALPFIKKAGRKAGGTRTQARSQQPKALEPDRLSRLAKQLAEKTTTRPRTKARMLGRINADFGGRLTDAEKQSKLDELMRLGVISVEPSGRIAYLN